MDLASTPVRNDSPFTGYWTDPDDISRALFILSPPPPTPPPIHSDRLLSTGNLRLPRYCHRDRCARCRSHEKSPGHCHGDRFEIEPERVRWSSSKRPGEFKNRYHRHDLRPPSVIIWWLTGTELSGNSYTRHFPNVRSSCPSEDDENWNVEHFNFVPSSWY